VYLSQPNPYQLYCIPQPPCFGLTVLGLMFRGDFGLLAFRCHSLPLSHGIWMATASLSRFRRQFRLADALKGSFKGVSFESGHWGRHEFQISTDCLLRRAPSFVRGRALTLLGPVGLAAEISRGVRPLLDFISTDLQGAGRRALPCSTSLKRSDRDGS
jgi:hypothetical protein